MAVVARETDMVEACVRSLEGALDATPTASWTATDPAVVRDLLTRLAKVEARISAHKMAAARVLDRIRAEERRKNVAGGGTCTSTGSTISIDFGGDRTGADALVSTANRIEEQTTHTEAALAAGDITAKQADVISRALASLPELAAPHQSVGTVNAATGEMDEVGFGQTYPQRLGHAFATLVEHLPADRLPTNGGVSAVVTVNLDLDTLMGGLKAAGLSDGTRISADQARRLACSAQLVPMVLNGRSLPLDLGSANRNGGAPAVGA